ncbi:glutathione-disulfide reductase [Candidatus Tokpelaia sp.]|uniref:glutathione-disulfide reductase n=1 Tax=Candidatus Tokpelaia sp. TaxID=2233777 RepID=UPI00123AE0C5|nr:glutathione-disulfide reductase [Candidatus Tokpelaia sp.]KAA6404697.1 glutathione-disulfide reductase [Candidatus Tokpelaia sp.]
MSGYDYDLFVIGGGSGGVRAARLSGARGLRVALAEEYRLGGTCVIRGCVPKKLFTYAASYAQDFVDAKAFGWRSRDVKFDWPTLLAAKNKEITRLEELYRHNVEASGVKIFHEKAQLLDRHTVQMAGGKVLRARLILIAAGAKPFVPDFPGADLCLTSNDIFNLEVLPQSVLIAGGGYIAVEFASILHDLGVEVTLVYRGGQILRGFDGDLRHLLEEEIQARGIKIIHQAVITHVKPAGGKGEGFVAELSDGSLYQAGQILLALGRLPNTAGLRLEKAGIQPAANGAVPVNRFMQTQIDNIYAVGDVTGGVELTPVAIHEAMCFVKTAFEGEPSAPDYHFIPTAVFADPEIGTVGLTEEEAAQQLPFVKVYRTRFRPLRNSVSGAPGKIFMKLLVDGESGIVVGAHILGGEAGETVQLLAIAVKGRVTKNIFDATMALHPSAAEELVTMYQPSYCYRHGRKQV